MPFHRPPRAGLLFDLDTGRVLWRRNPTRVLPIASLTKMMTALLVVAGEPPNAFVRITKEARDARSEERRVGKECRARGSLYAEKKKKKGQRVDETRDRHRAGAKAR